MGCQKIPPPEFSRVSRERALPVEKTVRFWGKMGTRSLTDNDFVFVDGFRTQGGAAGLWSVF
jgi:hypothetical protein